jgi:hypothetical protein
MRYTLRFARQVVGGDGDSFHKNERAVAGPYTGAPKYRWCTVLEDAAPCGENSGHVKVQYDDGTVEDTDCDNITPLARWNEMHPDEEPEAKKGVAALRHVDRFTQHLTGARGIVLRVYPKDDEILVEDDMDRVSESFRDIAAAQRWVDRWLRRNPDTILQDETRQIRK